jgi:hypothetical protein
VAPTPLENLYWASEIVVIGRDLSTFEKDGWRLAEFEIERVIKGDRSTTEKIYYLAESTWTCDVSHARPGSHALLFLHSALEKYHPGKTDSALVLGPPPPYKTDQGDTVYRITASGNGRLDLGENDQLSIVTAVVVLPDTLVDQAVATDDFAVTSTLPLTVLESHLRSLPARAPTPTKTTGPLPPSMLRP